MPARHMHQQYTLQFRVWMHYVYAGWPAGRSQLAKFECKPKKRTNVGSLAGGASLGLPSWLQLIVGLKTAQLCISVHIFSLSVSAPSLQEGGSGIELFAPRYERDEVCIFSFNTSGICYLLPGKFYFLLQLMFLLVLFIMGHILSLENGILSRSSVEGLTHTYSDPALV